jgi:hypothetical protein
MGFITTPVSYFRLNPIPLDTTQVYTTFNELTSYAQTSDKVYYGQICSVVDDGAYIINSDRSVTRINATGGGAGMTGTRTFIDKASFLNTVSIVNGSIVSWFQEFYVLWILLGGNWNDEGVWDDNSSWID